MAFLSNKESLQKKKKPFHFDKKQYFVAVTHSSFTSLREKSLCETYFKGNSFLHRDYWFPSTFSAKLPGTVFFCGSSKKFTEIPAFLRNKSEKVSIDHSISTRSVWLMFPVQIYSFFLYGISYFFPFFLILGIYWLRLLAHGSRSVYRALGKRRKKIE